MQSTNHNFDTLQARVLFDAIREWRNDIDDAGRTLPAARIGEMRAAIAGISNDDDRSVLLAVLSELEQRNMRVAPAAPVAADAAVDTPVTAVDTPVTAVDTPVTADVPVTAVDTPVTAVDTPVTAVDTPVTAALVLNVNAKEFVPRTLPESQYVFESDAAAAASVPTAAAEEVTRDAPKVFAYPNDPNAADALHTTIGLLHIDVLEMISAYRSKVHPAYRKTLNPCINRIVDYLRTLAAACLSEIRKMDGHADFTFGVDYNIAFVPDAPDAILDTEDFGQNFREISSISEMLMDAQAQVNGSIENVPPLFRAATVGHFLKFIDNYQHALNVTDTICGRLVEQNEKGGPGREAAARPAAEAVIEEQ